ncbi:MAG TPA: sulfatase [Pirellulales bacterium]
MKSPVMRNLALQFLLCWSLWIVGATSTTAADPAPEATKKTRPNVLFIAVDDLNDWVGAFGGNPQTRTPNIDALAARGVAFQKAYCAAPACNPSRASLMTGVRPSTSGVYHNNQPWKGPLKGAVTLTQQFMANGYIVEGGGKIFHGAYEDPSSWQNYFHPIAANRKMTLAPGATRTSAGGIVWGALAADDAQMPDTKTVDWAADFLQARAKEKDGKPFFLAVGLHKPHMPWQVPQKYYDLFPLEKIVLPEVKDDDLADVPKAGVKIAKPSGDHETMLESGDWTRAVQGYLASIAYTDGQIGRLIDALDKSGLKDDTIIVFWGDHGWHLGEKRHWRKFALWEEATRAPLIVVAPGVTPAGRNCQRTVDFMSLYPTICDLCGLPTPETSEGVSLRPLLADPTAAWDRPAITTHGRNNHAVRNERFRYIRYADGSEELYDHEADPYEWTNLASDEKYAAEKAKLAESLPKTNAEDAPAKKGAGGAEADPKAADAD